MAAAAEATLAEMTRHTRAFIMTVLIADAVVLRPDQPRLRGPLTPLAQTILHILTFHFENVLTGLCNPSIATIAEIAGCVTSSVKRLLSALRRTEYLTWKKGKRKRMLTRAGWRVVRSSNQYRMTCPRQHLADLRRMLIKVYGGRHGPLIQATVARYTPPSEEEKATTEIVETLAANLRPSPARTTQTAATQRDTHPPSQAPPAPPGSVEIDGVRVKDPILGKALAKLWAALEKREQGEDAES